MYAYNKNHEALVYTKTTKRFEYVQNEPMNDNKRSKNKRTHLA